MSCFSDRKQVPSNQINSLSDKQEEISGFSNQNTIITSYPEDKKCMQLFRKCRSTKHNLLYICFSHVRRYLRKQAQHDWITEWSTKHFGYFFQLSEAFGLSRTELNSLKPAQLENARFAPKGVVITVPTWIVSCVHLSYLQLCFVKRALLKIELTQIHCSLVSKKLKTV